MGKTATTIVVNNPRTSYYVGGAEVVSMEHAKGFMEKGLHVIFMTIKPSSINSLIYEENKIQYGVFYATFNKNDMSDKNKCVFHLYVKGVRLDNSEIKLKFS